MNNEALEKTLAWMRSPEGQESMKQYAAEMRAKEKIRDARVARVGEWVETHSFDELMLRLEKEHDEEWRDRCYKKGYEPYANHKMSLLLDYISENREDINIPWIDPMFLSASKLFKGYVFATFCGQGCFHRIYKYETQEVIFDC